MTYEVGTGVRRNHLHGLGQIMQGLERLLNLSRSGVVIPSNQASELIK